MAGVSVVPWQSLVYKMKRMGERTVPWGAPIDEYKRGNSIMETYGLGSVNKKLDNPEDESGSDIKEWCFSTIRWGCIVLKLMRNLLLLWCSSDNKSMNKCGQKSQVFPNECGVVQKSDCGIICTPIACICKLKLVQKRLSAKAETIPNAEFKAFHGYWR